MLFAKASAIFISISGFKKPPDPVRHRGPIGLGLELNASPRCQATKCFLQSGDFALLQLIQELPHSARSLADLSFPQSGLRFQVRRLSVHRFRKIGQFLRNIRDFSKVFGLKCPVYLGELSHSLFHSVDT